VNRLIGSLLENIYIEGKQIRRMTLTRPRNLVRDLLQVGVTTCPPETQVGEIARIFLKRNLEAVIVLDSEEGHALGVVGQEELIAAFINNKSCARADEVMREGVPQIPPDIQVEIAMQMMRDQRVRTLFLMHHASGIDYPAAYLSYAHIIRFLAAQNEEDLAGLGVEADRKNPLEAFIEKRDAAIKKVQSQRRE
jgi:predicted transcriptional regulator